MSLNVQNTPSEKKKVKCNLHDGGWNSVQQKKKATQ
jgi:hypothetical protein